MNEIYQAIEQLDLGPWVRDMLFAAAALAAAAVVFTVGLTIAGILVWVERRVAGRVQSRIGPNRVGPFGFLQWLADGLKLIMKEDLVPECADKPLYRIAPYVVMIGVFGAFAAVPFGQALIAADLNVGILYIMAITSLSAVGILMSGWASNNKWSLLGGIRSAAQIVSYEVPVGLGVLSVVLLAGTLQFNGTSEAPGIVAQQGGWPWQWYVFHNPFGLVAFVVYFTAALAEGNRTPFDLPEAESELVAGFNTEYSGMRFAGFFLAEFANVFLMSAVATALFFGGWQIPGVPAEAVRDSAGLQLLGLVVFIAKAGFGCFLVVWIRWTYPRLRIDQLMGVCYRYLVPMGFVALFGNALYLLLVPAGSTLDTAIHLVTFAAVAMGVVWFFWRVTFHIRHVGDKPDFDLLARGRVGPFDPNAQHRAWGAHRRRLARGN
ncbi:MAG: NADH-quinone oxidoreductase subunit NuoH [Deltaproteobacteria bacterium]|nr:MAG: NADH-quinone oxidoreductase subunit NuoH [Deltaproteobacteria bacterium]